MKFILKLATAVVAVTISSTSVASAAPSGTAVVQQEKPGRADPPGEAKGHDKQAGEPTPRATGKPSPKPTAKPTARPTAKPKAKPHAKPATKPTAKPTAKPDPGQAKKDPGKPTPGVPGTGGAPSPASGNENKKVTFCHVPPGNPANGHLITTSVNAIDPGHVNHPGDIIPPFSFLKHGTTVTFAGQNWDAAGQAALANGCAPVAPPTPGTSGGGSGVPSAVPAVAPPAGTIAAPPTGPTPGTSLVTEDPRTGTSTTSASADVPDDESMIEGLLPNTGGARLGLLIIGVALLAGGSVLVMARRRVL